MSGWTWGKIESLSSQKEHMNSQGKQALEQELALAFCIIYLPDGRWFGF